MLREKEKNKTHPCLSRGHLFLDCYSFIPIVCTLTSHSSCSVMTLKGTFKRKTELPYLMVLFWSNFPIGLLFKKSIPPCRRLL